MPEENLAKIRRSIELWNAGDVRSAEFTAMLAPDVVVVHPPGWPEPGPSIGVEEVLRQYERLKDTFAGDRLELVEARSAGDHVIARMRWEATGGASGADTELGMSAVYTFSEGLASRITFAWSEEQACEAAGLPSES